MEKGKLREVKFERPEDFYRLYDVYKQYEAPRLKKKHMRWYDREFWQPAECTSAMSVLEIGSGTGEFLSYLRAKKVAHIKGVEQDGRAIAVMDENLKSIVYVGDIRDFLAENSGKERFDRVVMLDVLEHFSVYEGMQLLIDIKAVLAPGGRVVARVPNMGSPLGGIAQYSDLTHKAAYTSASLEQLGQAAGYETLATIAQNRGSPFRRVAEDFLFWTLSKILSNAPVVWSMNIIVIFRPSSE
jgi:2-polyprenyl-3-methyl-5-hydroxy-6-metoxy-1,4-benzoquinol methylase